MDINASILSKITGLEDNQLINFYSDAIIKKIENLIGYSIEKSEKTEKILGIDKNLLYLTRRPVAEVSSVTIDNKDIPFEWSENQNYIMLNEIICCNMFVEVTYTAGYDELPNDLILLIGNLIKNEMALSNSNGMKSYKIKDIAYTWIDGLENDELFTEKVFNIFKVW